MKVLVFLLLVQISFLSCKFEKVSGNDKYPDPGNTRGHTDADLSIAYFDHFKFGVKYSKDLYLVKSNDSYLEVDNNKLISRGEEISSFSIEIYQDDSVVDLNILREIFIADYPTRLFRTVTYNSYSGLTSELKWQDKINRIDYILIRKGVFIVSKTSAFKDGEGLKKVEPVIRTIYSQ